jgi:hypothetical protein
MMNASKNKNRVPKDNTVEPILTITACTRVPLAKKPGNGESHATTRETPE